MKLISIRIRNFRCYQEEISIDLNNLTVLAGKNDAGKSTIFEAMALFFGEYKLESDDACVFGDKEDVRVIGEFSDLPEEIVLDANVPTNLEDEYLLNSDGNLEIHKVYNCSLKNPKESGVYACANHPTNTGCEDLLLLKNDALKKRVRDLNLDTTGIDLKVNTSLRKLVREHFSNDLQLGRKEIKLDKEDAKKIWDKIKVELPSFALFKSDRESSDQDGEAQDPMKAAIKEALGEKKRELEAISNYIEREVKKIAEQTLSKLKEMDEELAGDLNPRFNTPNWSACFKMGLTGDDEISINKRGSGVRRLILLNFFRAKAERNAKDKGASNVIYAIEEPETSQHPNYQRMLMQAFLNLSEDDNCQVFLSTHTPVLARLAPIKSLRFISKDEYKRRKIICGTEERAIELMAKSLGVLPDHDVRLFIGVEGPNDINFLTNISNVLKKEGYPAPDLKSLEENGDIIFFPLGGSNLALWVSRVKNLNRPEIYIFDRDVEPPREPKYQGTADKINERENCHAFMTSKREMENYIHPAAIKKVQPSVNISVDDFDDVPEKVARALHEKADSEDDWENLKNRNKHKKITSVKKWLNNKAVQYMTVEMLDEIDPDGEIKSWFKIIDEKLNNNVGN